MRSSIFIVLFLASTMVFAQQNNATNERKARSLVREGNELYQQKKYADAEVAYKKALEKNAVYDKAIYNLGNALYQQNRNEESVQLFETVTKNAKDNLTKAEAFHNLGNSNMQGKKYGPAVEAYKNALRNNSKDEETRYNLALAQKLLKDQQQNQDKKDDQQQDQKDNQKDNQDKKDNQQNKDDKKDPEKKDEQQKQPQQQPKPNQLSPQQMEQLLEAMNKEEHKTQKKVNAQKVTGNPNKKEKDW